MTTQTREKLEAIIRADVENMPYKYREMRDMLLHGVLPYKDMKKKEIDELFEHLELKVEKEDTLWAKYKI